MGKYMKRKLKLIEEHSILAGVCGGLAYYFGINVWIVRLLFFFIGPSAAIYLFLWLCLPRWETDPADYAEVCG